MKLTLEEFTSQDPLVNELSEHHSEQHTSLRRLQRELAFECRKVSMLMLAYDIVVKQMFSFEEVVDTEKIVEKVTGEPVDNWGFNFDMSSDTVLEAAVEKCREVGVCDTKLKRLREQAHQTCQSLMSAKTKAKKRFEEMQKASGKEVASES
tara:strand:- start:1122 stop:1574 length:453 start_codon:yes stop_codon:yes gene_type:complete